ncbi:hypothetical protein H9P43_006858 [Blastocladiella emersonii ATCC 22665]|nr:hypothetical protein H9P43_006858 [Blastocladiella emersonii ATCC 22665]
MKFKNLAMTSGNPANVIYYITKVPPPSSYNTYALLEPAKDVQRAALPALPLEPQQQLLKGDSDPAWFAQLANYTNLAGKADEDAHGGVAPPAVHVQLVQQEQLAPCLQGLNVEQRRVVKHVESTLDAIRCGDPDVKQLLMLVHDQAGMGKTAAPIGGFTIHAICSIGATVSVTKPMSNAIKIELEVPFRLIQFDLIDEISMVGAELFAAMHLRFDALYPIRDHRPFGGLHVLAFGAFL